MGRITELFLVGIQLTYLVVYLCYSILNCIYTWISPSRLKSLEGKVVLVTGSANGIGRAICRQLSQTGATIVCWDINQEDNESLLRELKDAGAKCYAYRVDITNKAEVKTLSMKVKTKVGPVSIIINNAGIMDCKKFLEYKDETLENIFKVNVFSHFSILREFLPDMIKSQDGHIVTLCSIAGLVGVRYLVPYCSSKHSVQGYIEALSDELSCAEETSCINFTTVYPYCVNTQLLHGCSTCKPRFSLLLPVLEADDVARATIDGLRRNKREVYVPWTVQLQKALRLLPYTFQKKFAVFVDSFVVPK